MGDYISRDSVINAVLELAKEPSIQKSPDTVNGLLGAYNILYEFPSADVRENIHGEWIDGMYEKCSVCGMEFLDDIINLAPDMGYPNFCPNCGADMRGGK